MSSINIAGIRAELEQELTWRRDEMRLLHNQLTYMQDKSHRERYRKSLIVMLYSHFEGFCITAFQIYIQAINDQNLKRKKLNNHLLASSLYNEFRAYDESDRKPKHYREIFNNNPPEDRKLSHLARKIDFVENMEQFLNKEATIPERIVHSENNLTAIVLRKLLYSVGLPHDILKEHEGKINELVNRRNAIAHGLRKDGIDSRTYSKIETSVFKLLNDIIMLIDVSLREKRYLKSG